MGRELEQFSLPIWAVKKHKRSHCQHAAAAAADRCVEYAEVAVLHRKDAEYLEKNNHDSQYERTCRKTPCEGS